MIFVSFRKFILATKKFDQFPDTLHMPAKSKRISPRIFFILKKYEKSESELRFQIKADERISVGFCPFSSMMKLNLETFENRGKMEIFAILDLRFPLEANIAHGNFCGIFAI